MCLFETHWNHLIPEINFGWRIGAPRWGSYGCPVDGVNVDRVNEGGMRMTQRLTGLVVGKHFKPPAGAPPEDWCYLVVDITDYERVSVRVERSQVDKAVLGDRVVFMQPRQSDQPVQWVRRF